MVFLDSPSVLNIETLAFLVLSSVNIVKLTSSEVGLGYNSKTSNNPLVKESYINVTLNSFSLKQT